MTVYKNMAFGLENSKMPKAEIDDRVRKAAELLQITDYLNRRPKALSGGQRQRVAIGRAIVRDPKAFLFDEPLSNLDAELRVTMRKELSALHANIGGTMIYVTHDQVEAMTLADKIVVLQKGVVEQVGPPLELYNKPCNAFVAGFIGSPRMNMFQGIAVRDENGLALNVGGALVAIPDVPALQDGDKVTLGVRPEHIAVHADHSGELSASVSVTEQLGGETYLYCDAPGLPQITVHQGGQLPFQRGQALSLSFDRARMHIFDADGKAVANGLST
jgi:multiple sugar transport system ATP-binding protein